MTVGHIRNCEFKKFDFYDKDVVHDYKRLIVWKVDLFRLVIVSIFGIRQEVSLFLNMIC